MRVDRIVEHVPPNQSQVDRIISAKRVCGASFMRFHLVVVVVVEMTD